MKRNLFLCLMILMVMCCVGCASVKISEDDTTQDVTEDSSKDDDILEELKNVDLSNMTPIDALNKLYELQNKIKNRW
jgi:uncharacterized protein YceK